MGQARILKKEAKVGKSLWAPLINLTFLKKFRALDDNVGKGVKKRIGS